MERIFTISRNPLVRSEFRVIVAGAIVWLDWAGGGKQSKVTCLEVEGGVFFTMCMYV